MIESTPLKSVKSKIDIDFNNEDEAKIIYEAIILEFKTVPDYRSSMDVKLNGLTITININAKDSTSFRASFNSAIKWIKLSLEINRLVN